MRRAVAPEGTTQKMAAEELKRRVSNLSPGTYLADILAQQDSALYRWPDRISEALRVYIAQSAPIAGWQPQYPLIAQNVFGEWGETGFPLRFVFVYDSATADITIGWVDKFPAEDGRRIGVTDRTQTSSFAIAKAHILIANHDSAGRALSPTTVGGVIRHEIGHALGLNHSSDPASVMYRESATAAISQTDKATLRVIYLVSGGSLK